MKAPISTVSHVVLNVAKPQPKHAVAPKPKGTPRPVAKPKPKAPGHPDLGVVHPGAFCAPAGATGRTVKGTPMTCKTKPGDSRNRWRSTS